jgi:hypothetical protein
VVVMDAIFERLFETRGEMGRGHLEGNVSALRRRRNPLKEDAEAKRFRPLISRTPVNGNGSLSESECKKIVFLFGIRNRNMTF